MDKLQVSKSDRKHDFLVWRVQVQSFLEANNWFATIDGSLVKTPRGNAREWTKSEAKAKAVALNTIEKNVVRSIMNPRTAAEMCGRLCTLYESRSTLSVSLLTQEFYSYRITSNMDMATHIANVESMVQRLSDLGKAMEEDEEIAKLLQLPTKYQDVVVAWDHLDEKLQTFLDC